MEKKDILILVLVGVTLLFSIYRRYKKKKDSAPTKIGESSGKKSGLSGQPDDYVPYSGNKNDNEH